MSALRILLYGTVIIVQFGISFSIGLAAIWLLPLWVFLSIVVSEIDFIKEKLNDLQSKKN